MEVVLDNAVGRRMLVERITRLKEGDVVWAPSKTARKQQLTRSSNHRLTITSPRSNPPQMPSVVLTQPAAIVELASALERTQQP